jgi:hypothetical protein
LGWHFPSKNVYAFVPPIVLYVQTKLHPW